MVDTLDPKPFLVDGWLVLPQEHTLSREGKTQRIEPKVMELLVYFARHQGEVISRENLENDVWHGALVGYDATTSTIGKLRKALKDNSKNPRIIVTVPKRGYQFIAKVEAVDPTSDINNHGINSIISSTDSKAHDQDFPVSSHSNSLSHSAAASQDRHLQSRKVMGLLGTLTILLCILLALLVIVGTNPDDKPAAPPTLLVLPIENMQNDKSYDVFLDGITEDLITDLSRFSNLRVLASNTSFRIKDLNSSTASLQQALALDYILEGSVRRNNASMRINLQLIDAKRGVNIWAQRYDRNTDEIFTLQDQIIQELIAQLNIYPKSSNSSIIAKRATNNLQAYEFFLEGQRLSRIQSKQSNLQARELYKKAIMTDPEYGRAYGALAYTYALDFGYGWTDTPIENLDHALQMANKGIKLNPNIPQTYWSLGYVLARRKEYNKALEAAMHSIRIAPNYADGYGLLGLISNGLAEFDKALEYIRKGKQLNPYYSWDYLFNEGFALYMKGHYKEAIAIFEKAEQRNEIALPLKLGLAVSYVNNNQLDDAQWKIEQIKQLNSNATIQHLSNAFILQIQPYKDRYLNDLRKAGLPE